MSSYKVRQEKHEKAKKMLKWDFDAYYNEPANRTELRVTIGWGKPVEVSLAVNKYIHEMKDRLRLVTSYTGSKYLAMKEERAGMIGVPSYLRERETSWFEILDEEEREEFYELVGEEDWSAIGKMFGGKTK